MTLPPGAQGSSSLSNEQATLRRRPSAAVSEDAESTVQPQAKDWQPDSETEACMRCRAKFSWPLKKKHHCRKCGLVVCSGCSPARQLVPDFHPTELVRVCKVCEDKPMRPETIPEGGNPEGETAEVPPTGSLPTRQLSAIGAQMGPVPSGIPDDFGVLRLSVVEAKGLVAADVNWRGQATSSDPYCVVGLEGGPQFSTRDIRGTLEPKWDEEVSFYMARPHATLTMKLFDKDLTSRDDLLGSVSIPLGGLRPGRKARGWVPLEPADGEEGPAGAVLLEMELGSFRERSHLKKCLMPPPGPPKPPDSFDINAIFAPSMKLLDLLWTQLFAPALFDLLDLLFWTNPRRSFLVLVAFNIMAAWFLEHWPALILLRLAAYMLSRRSQRVWFDPAEVYSIESVKAANKCLNVAGGSAANHANVHLWDNPDCAHSQWRIRRHGDVFVVESFNARGMYLSVQGGGKGNGLNVRLSTNPESERSQWRLGKRPGGVYTLESAYAQTKYVNICGGGADNGTAVWVWDNPYSPETQWRVVRQTPGVVNQAAVDAQASGRQPLLRQLTQPLLGKKAASGELVDKKSEEDASLGKFVATVAMIAPRFVKDLGVTFAPLLRLAADACQTARDLLAWEHPGSPGFVGALLVAALFCELVPFRVLVMLVGSGVLVALSPVLTAALGLVSYLQWKLGSPDELRDHGMFAEYLEEWSSAHYRPKAARAAKAAAGPAAAAA